MSDDKKQPTQEQEPEQFYTLHINGQCPTQREAKRILTAPAKPVDEADLATKPLHSVVRGFNPMR